jgi:Domain of unknown function (DUF3854)
VTNRYPSICGRCHEDIDREAVLRAIADGAENRHTCGRVLQRASGHDLTQILLEPHRDRLHRSALTNQVIVGRAYRSVTDRSTGRQIGHARNVPLPAIDIPTYDVEGRLAYHQLRSDKPQVGKDGKEIKYKLPRGTVYMLDVHPSMTSEVAASSHPLYVTEGTLKADALVSAGFPAVGLNGVWGWMRKKKPLDDWNHILLQDRDIYIVFDSDIATNPDIAESARRLKRFLVGGGARPKTLRIGRRLESFQDSHPWRRSVWTTTWPQGE